MQRGTIRFGGATEFHPGQWAGVELDSAIGKNDGSYGGIRYFSCKPKFGLFVPMHRISKDTRERERERESGLGVGERRKKLVKSKDSPARTASLSVEGQARAAPVKSEIQASANCPCAPGDRV